MNIFVTDTCPAKSAQILDDRRVNKMIIESLQMLAYAIAQHTPESQLADLLPLTKEGRPYKIGGPHKKHPCSVWAGKTRGNFLWLVLHTVHLIKQKEIRYPNGKETSVYRKGIVRCFLSRTVIPAGAVGGFQNSSNHKHISDVIEAYQLTMIEKWKNAKINATPTWNNSCPPGWYSVSSI